MAMTQAYHADLTTHTRRGTAERLILSQHGVIAKSTALRSCSTPYHGGQLVKMTQSENAPVRTLMVGLEAYMHILQSYRTLH